MSVKSLTVRDLRRSMTLWQVCIGNKESVLMWYMVCCCCAVQAYTMSLR